MAIGSRRSPAALSLLAFLAFAFNAGAQTIESHPLDAVEGGLSRITRVWSDGIAALMDIRSFNGNIAAVEVVLPKKYVPFPVSIQNLRATVMSEPNAVSVRGIRAQALDGNVSGDIVVDFGGADGYAFDRSTATFDMSLSSVQLGTLRRLAALPFDLNGSVSGTISAQLKGSSIQTVNASFKINDFSIGGFAVKTFSGRLIFSASDRTIRLEEIDARIYEGALVGTVRATLDESLSISDYVADVQLEGIDLGGIRELPGLAFNLRGLLSARLKLSGKGLSSPDWINGELRATSFAFDSSGASMEIQALSTDIAYDATNSRLDLRAMDMQAYDGRARGQVSVQFRQDPSGAFLDHLAMTLEVTRLDLKSTFRRLNVEFINDGTADGTVFVSYSAKQKRTRVFGALSITNFILRDVISIKSVSGGVAWDSDRNIIELNALSGELLDGRFNGTGAVFLVKDDSVPPPLISVSSHTNGDVVRAGETISGWAYASNGIRSVEYRVNGGDWRSADGTADWRLSIEPTTDSPSLVLAVRATSAETGQTLLSETRVRLTVSDEINNQGTQVRRPAVIPPPDVRIRTMSRDQIRFILNGIADNISVAHLNDAYGSAALDVNGRLFGPVALRTNRSGLAELLADVRIAGFKYGRYDVDSMDVRATYRRGDASLALTADTISIYGGSGQAAILLDLDRNGKITAFRDGRLTVKELSLTAMSERLDWKTRIGGLMDLNLNSITGNLSEKKALRGWGDFKTYKGELYKLDLLKQGAIFISGFNSSTLSQATGDLFLYGDEIRLMSASVKSRDGETEMFMDADVGPPAAFDYDGDIRQAFLLNWRTPPRAYEAIPGVGWVYKIRRFTSALGRLRVSGSFENPDITNWSFQIFRSSDTLLKNYKRKIEEERRTADEGARIARRLLLLPPDGSSIETDFSAPIDALSGRRTLTKDPTEPEIGD